MGSYTAFAIEPRSPYGTDRNRPNASVTVTWDDDLNLKPGVIEAIKRNADREAVQKLLDHPAYAKAREAYRKADLGRAIEKAERRGSVLCREIIKGTSN